MNKKLKCPNCGTGILSSDINLDKGLAKCGACHLVFDFQEGGGAGSAAKRLPTPHKEEIFTIPKGIQVLRMMSELEIDVRWRHSTSWFLMVFALFWNGILLPMALGIILSGEYLLLLFLSVHLAVGLGLIYWVLAMLFNTTYINVDSHYITIEHRPFKLFIKEHRLPVHEVEQLYVEKYTHSTTNGQPNYAYTVKAKMKGPEEDVQMVKGIGKAVQARYIEQEIEKFAQIDDRPVRGELRFLD